jgi:PAS domain S-box-containing protein
MDERPEELEAKVVSLEAQVRHLTNELSLAKDEYERASRSYFELYSDMENKVLEKSRELKEMYRRLKEKNRLLEVILDSSPEIIYFKDERSRFIEVNRMFARTLGLSKFEILGKTYTEVFPDKPNAILGDDSSVIGTGEAELNKTSLIETTRGQTPVVVDKVPYKDIDGKVIGVVGFVQDVGELKQAEEEILSSLKEKEILLKEIQHRVKNNLQVISSLIDLKSRKVQNREALDILNEIRNKVFTMALIHAMLFDADRFDRIDMKLFVNKLVNHLFQVYRSETRITPVLRCDSVFLSMRHAMPCGLVINELVSNVFKHAFRGRSEGRIEISLAQSDDGNVTVRVRDDGVGLGDLASRAGGASGAESNGSLGMKLATLIVRDQLKGSISVAGAQGTSVEIAFLAVA